MSSKAMKIIYTDNDRDIAITGQIVEEDEFFLTVLAHSGIVYRIGKKAVVCIKETGR